MMGDEHIAAIRARHVPEERDGLPYCRHSHLTKVWPCDAHDLLAEVDRLRAQRDQARGIAVALEQELAELWAGADRTPPAEGTWPTPAQWIGWFLSLDGPARLACAARSLDNRATAHDCWAFGHVSRLEDADRLIHQLRSEISEVRRRELDNHHNAAACPYCSPHIEAVARQRDDALVLLRQMEHYVGPYGDRVREFLAALHVQGGTKLSGNPSPATIPYRRRLASCVAAWPDAEDGAYNPACCRFPKSCSPHPFGPVDGGELESMPAWGVEPEAETALTPRRLPSGALPTDGDATTVVPHQHVGDAGQRCRWHGPHDRPPEQRDLCMRPADHPVHTCRVLSPYDSPCQLPLGHAGDHRTNCLVYGRPFDGRPEVRAPAPAEAATHAYVVGGPFGGGCGQITGRQLSDDPDYCGLPREHEVHQPSKTADLRGSVSDGPVGGGAS